MTAQRDLTHRAVLMRIIDRVRNPATLELSEIMTEDPETLPAEARIAWVLMVHGGVYEAGYRAPAYRGTPLVATG